MENTQAKYLKIALLGYGKMGHEIEAIAKDAGHKIALIIDTHADWQEKESLLNKVDVAIDFSLPESAVSNIKKCFAAKVPIVVGTTGWYSEFEAIKNLCMEEKNTLFYASNFSLGVNIFSAVNTKLAEIMNRFPDYRVSLKETHHTQKLDAPSGTAITLAEGIIRKTEKLKSWELVENKSPEQLAKDLLPITAIREEQVPGTHEIVYHSEVDFIEIKHEAKNRKGFAKGAVLAAEWIVGKTGLFTMNDLLAL
ncbi:MAG: 4-hydroxy-tetrahydrodipicolinate reductase [Bacteroidales bacterium]|nr:4-hydroxy-tetrahydrodipicolinate reductase [Bacteroidales bacterium]